MLSRISRSYSKSATTYCLLLFLAQLGFFLNKIFTTDFSQDEYQHTYLAWATGHFDKLIFRDIMDNHGITHWLLNLAYITVFKPVAGLDTLLELRLISVLLLAVCILSCFVLLYQATRNYYCAILLPLIFCSMQISRYAVQIRPDILQTVFLNTGLILILHSVKTNKNVWALASGICFGLMLMTSLKSGIALVGLGLAFLYLRLVRRVVVSFRLVYSFSIGIGIVVLLVLIWLTYSGSLRNYFLYNILLSFEVVADTERIGFLTANRYTYLSDFNWPLTAFLIVSYYNWCKSALKPTANSAQITLMIMHAVLMLGKFMKIWLQYDLCFAVLLAGIGSWFALKLLSDYAEKWPNFMRRMSPILMCGLLLLITWNSWVPFIRDYKANNLALVPMRNTLNYVIAQTQSGETVEAFSSKFPGFGFSEHASYMILKTGGLMKLHEKYEGREFYKQSYIRMLDERRVKFLFVVGAVDYLFTADVRAYIKENYTLTNYFWERSTPFKNPA